MKHKYLILFALLLFALSTSMSLFAQSDRQNAIANAIRDRYGNAGSGKVLVRCTEQNTTSIEIYRDEDASTIGHSFYITIKDDVTIRHAGEYDGMTGIVDTYYDRNPGNYKWAIQKINHANLYKTSGLKSKKNRKGITRIDLYRGDHCWMSLVDSKDNLNVTGDLMKLVDDIVEYTGGEPEFGGPVIDCPGPEPIIDEPTDGNYPVNIE